ncbi:MAG: hypothetical protein EP334_03230 [Gammaproteobacteria bacterium]|nr:MAG: hypothetical protein EP334_03230 [Gammaproteobacteria bacterium]
MELRDFLRLASKRERAELASVCNGSVSYLYQLAGKHRYASALLAIRIEQVSKKMAQSSCGRLQSVPRESLVRTSDIFDSVNEILSEEYTSLAN